MIKRIWKYIITFVVTVACLTGLLVAVACIPRSLIRDNVARSAEFLCESEVFFNMIDRVPSSRIDRYADSILLGIAYQYDGEHPLESVMWSSYYFDAYQNENENLRDAVTQGLEANHQYMRYWHGSIALVRPMLIWLSVQQMYVLNGVVLAVLGLVLLGQLLHHKAYVPAVGIVLGLVSTSFWWVCLSLEYTWTYLFMFLFSILVVHLVSRGHRQVLGFVFMVSGMVTVYMDFLTTETLTLTVPLLLALWFVRRREPERTLRQTGQWTIGMIAMWGIGYAGMWIMKWLLASLALGENMLPYVSEHIAERSVGTDTAANPLLKAVQSLGNNMRCLFPLEYGVVGVLIAIGCLLLALYVGYVYHRENINWGRIGCFLMVGLLPYARYIVMAGHSVLHFFFTYRAQFAIVLALALILEEVVNWDWVLRDET